MPPKNNQPKVTTKMFEGYNPIEIKQGRVVLPSNFWDDIKKRSNELNPNSLNTHRWTNIGLRALSVLPAIPMTILGLGVVEKDVWKYLLFAIGFAAYILYIFVDFEPQKRKTELRDKIIGIKHAVEYTDKSIIGMFEIPKDENGNQTIKYEGF